MSDQECWEHSRQWFKEQGIDGLNCHIARLALIGKFPAPVPEQMAHAMMCIYTSETIDGVSFGDVVRQFRMHNYQDHVHKVGWNLYALAVGKQVYENEVR